MNSDGKIIIIGEDRYKKKDAPDVRIMTCHKCKGIDNHVIYDVKKEILGVVCPRCDAILAAFPCPQPGEIDNNLDEISTDIGDEYDEE